MTLTSRLKLTAIAAAAATAALWFGATSPAQAQYYGHPGYGYAPPGYVSPKILRKQREKQMRIIQKYGYQPGYGYGRPVYRQPPAYGYGYGGPVYRRPEPNYAPPGVPIPQGYRAPGYRSPVITNGTPYNNYN